jgi:hypothetical protein
MSTSEILRPHSLSFSSFPLRNDDSAKEYCQHDADFNDELYSGRSSVEVQILTEYRDREVRPYVVRLCEGNEQWIGIAGIGAYVVHTRVVDAEGNL